MRRGTTCCFHLYISFAESRTRCIRVLVLATIQRWAYNVTHVRNNGISMPEKKINMRTVEWIRRNDAYEHLMYQVPRERARLSVQTNVREHLLNKKIVSPDFDSSDFNFSSYIQSLLYFRPVCIYSYLHARYITLESFTRYSEGSHRYVYICSL